MSIGKAASRYAIALVDLAIEKGQSATVKDELGMFAEFMQQAPELREVFANPAISRRQKEDVLQSLLERAKPGVFVQNLLRLLLKNGRLQSLIEIHEAYLRQLDVRMGIATAEVETARPLREDEQNQLRIRLEKLTGKKVRLLLQTNPEILGGAVARIGSEIYDGSIRTQLENIRRQLSR